MADRHGSPWLTPTEAAAYARCSVHTMRALISTGVIPSHPRLGGSPDNGRVIVYSTDIDEVIRSNVVRTPLSAAICGGLASKEVYLDLVEGERD